MKISNGVRKYRYKKNYRARKKKSIIKNKFFWMVFLVLIISGGVLYLFIFSSVFQIKNIQVLGAQKISAQDITDVISANSGNIFLTNFGKINKIILEKYPQIANINFERKFPDSLIAQIEERKPEVILCNNDCFFVDREGVAFEKVSEARPGMLIIRAQSISQEQVSQILKIKSNQTVPFEEISIVSDTRFNVKTTEGWEIYFNPKENLDWQLTELNIILKERIPPDKRRDLEYIDLRFEKIFIFPETYR